MLKCVSSHCQTTGQPPPGYNFYICEKCARGLDRLIMAVLQQQEQDEQREQEARRRAEMN